MEDMEPPAQMVAEKYSPNKLSLRLFILQVRSFDKEWESASSTPRIFQVNRQQLVPEKSLPREN